MEYSFVKFAFLNIWVWLALKHKECGCGLLKNVAELIPVLQFLDFVFYLL